METTSAFNLDAAIPQWRDHLGQSPQFRAENLDELETHLRDSVVTLQGKGLSSEEAFLVAARRIGSAAALGPEFSKVNAREVWLNRGLWALLGIQLWGLISAISVAFGQLSIGSLSLFGYRFETPGQSLFGLPILALPTALYILTNVTVLIVTTAGCRWLIRRNGERVRGCRGLLRRRSFCILGAIALCLVMFSSWIVSQSSFVLFSRVLGAESFGAVSISSSIGNIVIFFLQTIVLAVLTLLLARRQLRLASAPCAAR